LTIAVKTRRCDRKVEFPAMGDVGIKSTPSLELISSEPLIPGYPGIVTPAERKRNRPT
jgi:hypothetical protein